MSDFYKLQDKINTLDQHQKDINKESLTISSISSSNDEDIDDLTSRINVIKNVVGLDCADILNINANNDIEDVEEDVFFNTGKVDADKFYDMNKVDILVACLAGGLAVVVDCIVVKTPKNIILKNKDATKIISGSSLTSYLKEFGINENGKEAKWINSLEKWFKVNYDQSYLDGIKGMYPKNHRVYSLGHDPSIMGLVWGVKDIVCNTSSFIDKEGILHIVKSSETTLKQKMFAPIFWLGHIISDMFTKAGIPIPGSSFLRILQIGSYGEKKRTIGQIVEYMYVSGYDLRHLMTASTANAVIEIIIRLYLFLLRDNNVGSNEILSEKEYHRVKTKKKKHVLLMTSYSIAVTGNIAKIAAYSGSPNAINIPIWYSFAKEAVTQLAMLKTDSDNFIQAIENRHSLNEHFEQLLKFSGCQD